MSKLDRKARPRRIAADEAHAWARNLRLSGNHHAKAVLRSLTLYVNGDGECYVSLDQLADDCEFSADTVRRRLGWLEEIGALVRIPQWIDANGCRNGKGEGKRTTDTIKLCLDADTDIVEARARGEEIDETDAVKAQISPSSLQGLNSVSETVSPTLGVGQPSQSCDPLISEPEPESSPLPPSRGREADASDQVLEEPDDFGPAWQGWRGHEVMRRDLALAEFRKLTPEQQRLCRSAIGPYNIALDRNHRTKHRENFHLWIRRRGFEEFQAAAVTCAYAADSAEARSICAIFQVAGHLDFLLQTRCSKIDGSVSFNLPVTPRLLALATLPARDKWVTLTVQQAAAWDGFVGDFVKLAIRRRFAEGSVAPWPWPPKKDGTTYTDGDAA
jgi:hypothetical protein